MIDIFEIKQNLNNITCHSGGAEGSDTQWELIGEDYGVKTRSYSHKTPSHKSKNKIEISDIDYKEGLENITKANKTLNRYGISKYMNLLARNWAQVKYSNEIYAIGYIVKSKTRNDKGYYNNSDYDLVDGGTGYAVQMGIDNQKMVYVYDQKVSKWFRWSYTYFKFIETETPSIKTSDFAGIGTRKINDSGIQAIRDIYNKTFKK